MNGHVEVYRDKSDEWRWRRWKGTRVVSDSGEGYTRKAAALSAAAKYNPDVPVQVTDPPDEQC